MRTIKFRGKRVDNGEWIYGYLCLAFNATLIAEPPFHKCLVDHSTLEVIPETVGQFTGLLDKNGKEIYEGDVLSTQTRDVSFEIVWVQENSSFMFKSNDSLNLWEVDKSVNKLEVIGNIHDNKEIK